MPSQSTPTVLVAEDDPGFRALIAERLRLEGFDVVEVEDGRRLLALLEANLSSVDGDGVDAVVCDHRMPMMSGLKALRYLRGWDRVVPFILITGFCDDEVRRTATAWGAAGILSKPFELDALVTMLDRVL